LEAVNHGATEVDLSGLFLNIIPNEIFKDDVQWINLDLGFNRFSTFPKTLYNFSFLEELWLTGNQITFIPEDINLPSIRILYLNGNKISKLPENIDRLTTLEKIDLANNQITSLPSTIGKLKKLAELFLSGNPISSLPPSIGHLEFLEILDISGCKIKSLPNEFPGMVRLLELNLGNNLLTQLPSEFGKMSRLVSLNLSDNRLTELPISMGNCSHLDTVLLERNPIRDQELLKKYAIGTDHLLDYLGKKYFAQNQIEKKKLKDNARKAGAAKLRDDMKKAAAKVRSIDDDEGFEEIIEEEEKEVTPEEKRVKMRATAQKLSNDCRNEVITLKRALMKANTMDQIVPIARAVRSLIPHMNTAREHMAPTPKPQPPIFNGSEPKEVQLKKTTAVAIKEFEGVLGGIFNIVSGNAQLEQLIPLSSAISGSLEVLQEITKELPPQF
jgi:Leucine-rich repeat (LRR) protein